MSILYFSFCHWSTKLLQMFSVCALHLSENISLDQALNLGKMVYIQPGSYLLRGLGQGMTIDYYLVVVQYIIYFINRRCCSLCCTVLCSYVL